MGRFSVTRDTSLGIRFFDNVSATGKINTIREAMTTEEKEYTVINNAHTSNSKTVNVDTAANTVTFVSTSIANPPSGFPAQTTGDFTIFINGVAVEKEAVTSIAQSSANVVVTLNTGSLDHGLSATDEYMITGKLQA